MKRAAKTKLLIIEDDESTRWLLGLFLQKAFSNFDYRYAESAIEGIKLLKSERVDLVICDYNMNGGLGTEVLEYLRDTNSSKPFILYTSEDLNRIPHVSYLWFSYIQKPDIDALVDEVVRQLRI